MDPDDGTWIDYNSATAYHAIVDSSSLKTTNTGSNYDAGEFDISALFADKADYAPWTNYTFRVEVTDDAATDPEAIMVYDEFMVHVYDLCYRNQITQISQWTEDVTYTIEADGSTAAVTVGEITFNSTETESECPLTRTIEIWHDTSNSWLVYDASNTTLTGWYPFIDDTSITNDSEFDIQTEDYGTYDDDTMDPTVI